MSAFDIDNLLAEINPEAPCGEDISYDPAFMDLEATLRPRAAGAVASDEEDQAHEPNWKDVANTCAALLQRSKHLMVSVYFALALLKTEGLPGLRDGLYLVEGLLERFWEGLYPLLDPDDNNDPTERLNILMSLSPAAVSDQDPVQFRQRLAEVPLCSSRRAGTFSMRDVLVASGEITVSADADASIPDMGVIQAAFQDTNPDELEATLDAAREALIHIDRIGSLFEEKAMGGQGPNLNGLAQDVAKIERLLQGMVEGQGPTLSEEDSESEDTGSSSAPLTGDISSRKDALQALEKVCRYFDRHEPSSPIPLLLRRAQRLMSKNFIEIVQDICPDAMDRVELIGGVVQRDDEE